MAVPRVPDVLLSRSEVLPVPDEKSPRAGVLASVFPLQLAPVLVPGDVEFKPDSYRHHQHISHDHNCFNHGSSDVVLHNRGIRCMNKVAFKYVKTAVSLCGAPAWTAPVLHRLLLLQGADGEILLTERSRKRIAGSTRLTPNAVNQAIFQLTAAGLLERKGTSRFIPRLDVFPVEDWANVRKLTLTVDVTADGTYIWAPQVSQG